jgi:glycosyltransferase involved in cell wall biosynthesis
MTPGIVPAPLVSVVLITYNCAQYVSRAMESVLAQTWKRLELIVVDDGSTDATAGIIARFGDPRVQYVRQENAGIGSARNHGIRRARGELLSFLDCDDWWLPQKIERQIARVVADPSVGLVYSLANQIAPSGRQDGRAAQVVEGHVVDRLLLGNCIAGSASSALVTRAAVEDAGWFNESLRAAEDWDYWIRVAARFPVACVPSFDVFLLNRPGSVGKNAAAIRDASLQFVPAALRRYAPGRPWFHRKALSQLHFVASYNFNRADQSWAARRELMHCLLLYPFRLEYYKRMLRLWPRRRKAGR